MSKQLLPAIANYLQTAADAFDNIDAARRLELEKIADGVVELLHTSGKAALIYVCTHNSRRSHMGQLWAAAAAAYYDIQGVTSYSGGTEVTAFNPNAIQALQEAGFEITTQTTSDNPLYAVTYAKDLPAVIAFSKKYTEAPNPDGDFIAVMTCTHADEHCPLVAGATMKVATPYEDPKNGDGTPSQAAGYRERCRQIATEVLYTFYLVKTKQ